MENKKILIVEDEEVLLELYYTILTCRNYQNRYKVYTASSINEALSCTDQIKFDLILTDYHLPVEDGISLIKKIHQKSPYTKFVIISGYLSGTDLEEAIRHGTKLGSQICQGYGARFGASDFSIETI